MIVVTEDPGDVTPRDLFLASELSEDAARQYLASRGFRDPSDADRHLQQLADDLPTRLALGELAGVLLETLTEAPDPDGALVGFCRYVATRAPKSSLIGYLSDDPRALEILTYLLGSSPFLSEVLIRNPEYFHWLQRELDGPAPDSISYREELDALVARDEDPPRQIDALKRFQRREMLRIAARDLLGKDTLRSSTEQLSSLADIVVEGAIRIVLNQTSPHAAPPGAFVVIGMGKLGGRELNYSSDIDLIYLYEATDPEDSAAHEYFQKFGRRLTALLGEHTDEGYLYRVDLRLRPMGKRGNVVYSLKQSAHYYETLGETFERFALIKARPIAGDIQLGERFLELVRPFVYRKYLDHAALEELGRYKARADREHLKQDEAERNVKQGRGGIREIELFTQVFQLIYGGSHRELQASGTLAALQDVHRFGFIEADVLKDLADAYEFLRKVEHSLQVVQEGQTHTLPTKALELTVLARRLGFSNATDLHSALADHHQRVHTVYERLFESRPDDAEFQGRQLFRLLAGELADDEGVEYFKALGMPEPEQVHQAVSALDDVASLAHSKTSTRNLLANLLATMLDRIALCESPTRIFHRFEQVVSNARAPAALYRSLLENDQLRDRLIMALDVGELFARRLARYPELLDFLVAAPMSMSVFRQSIDDGVALLNVAGDTDSADALMDPFRRFKALEEFKALVGWLADNDLAILNEKLSLVAEVALDWIASRVAAEQGNGTSSTRWVIFALGKLGGRELTVHSDLDLVFLYDGDPSDSEAYARQQAFVRAIHRFLEEPTAAGSAYSLDTRLRPEGRKGALAIPVVAFQRYLDTPAETWERLAWTRGRPLCGSEHLAADVSKMIHRFVYGPWDASMPQYARHIRGRMVRELSQEASGQRRDLKIGSGGLADIDFLLQLVQIREGEHRNDFRIAGTRRLLQKMPETEFIDAATLGRLRGAYEFLRTLETTLRIATDSSRGWISTDPKELETLAARIGMTPETGEALLARYNQVTRDVRETFESGMRRLEAD